MNSKFIFNIFILMTNKKKPKLIYFFICFYSQNNFLILVDHILINNIWISKKTRKVVNADVSSFWRLCLQWSQWSIKPEVPSKQDEQPSLTTTKQNYEEEFQCAQVSWIIEKVRGE